MQQDYSLDRAATELSNRIYEASRILEDLERKIVGNGHHARQNICQLAIFELVSRWGNHQEFSDWLAAQDESVQRKFEIFQTNF